MVGLSNFEGCCDEQVVPRNLNAKQLVDDDEIETGTYIAESESK